MKNGIGPQSLGAPGMSPNSKPCGTPLDFNAGLRAAEKAGKLPESFAEKVRADSPNNSGSPLNFQDDISKIQEAASTLEAHNIGSGGGGAAAAPTGDVGAQQAGMVMDSMGAGGTPGTGRALGSLASRFTKGNLGRLFGRMKRRM
jgi:hypothetical protein